MEEEIVFECPPRLALYPDLSNAQQTTLVVLAFIFIGIMTIVFLNLYKKLDSSNPPSWWNMLKQSWPLLGLFPYIASGYQFHFVDANEFLCVTPPNGTWGWWYMPVSTEFQLAATGYIEIIGGLLLFVCGIVFKNNDTAISIRKASALCLFVTTVGMTFANLYMLTHGVWAYPMEDAFPLAFHVVRYIVQGLWLSNLWYMATNDSLTTEGNNMKRD